MLFCTNSEFCRSESSSLLNLLAFKKNFMSSCFWLLVGEWEHGCSLFLRYNVVARASLFCQLLLRKPRDPIRESESCPLALFRYAHRPPHLKLKRPNLHVQDNDDGDTAPPATLVRGCVTLMTRVPQTLRPPRSAVGNRARNAAFPLGLQRQRQQQ